MKKDRNSFFSEYNMSSYNMQQPMMPNMYPNQVSSQSSFYSGPAMNYGYGMTDQNNMMQPNNTMNMNNTYTTDIDSRISKIERQINRIETRLNKLEGELANNYNNASKDIAENVYTNNMYMV